MSVPGVGSDLRRIGVLTSGGDCPGLNAAIRAVVRRAANCDVDVIGFHDAWRGVIEGSYEPLDVETCRGILPRGGTILGTSRVSAGRTPEGIEAARSMMDGLELDGYLVIGGDGSLAGADVLNSHGVPTIGLPKTIDNDLAATEMSFGFDTAVHVASAAIDRLHTTAEAHDRVMVVEVMGRHAGHIAVRAGLAGGATAILVPEDPFDIAAVGEHLRQRHRRGKYASIVVVAEGATPRPGTLDLPEFDVDEFGHQQLGGMARRVAVELAEITGFETRTTELGYVQRGGTPTAFDRVLASRCGVAAVDAALAGEWGRMVALQSDRMVTVPLRDASAAPRGVDPELLAAVRNFAV